MNSSHDIERVAVVTGATSGIGAVTAARLHADGFAVVVAGRDTTRGRQVVERLGSRSVFARSDLTEPGAAQSLIASALDRYGRVDVVVNNAALDHTGDLLDTSEDDVRAVFEVNSLAAVSVLQAAGRAMRDAGGGSIINVTSRLASIGVPSMSVYSASKGALRSLTTAAAVELAPHNIRVNAVAPGFTRTPMYDQWLLEQADPQMAEAALCASVPLGRPAEPDDVAATISFLASPQASYITGASIPVDGGYTAQ